LVAVAMPRATVVSALVKVAVIPPKMAELPSGAAAILREVVPPSDKLEPMLQEADLPSDKPGPMLQEAAPPLGEREPTRLRMVASTLVRRVASRSASAGLVSVRTDAVKHCHSVLIGSARQWRGAPRRGRAGQTKKNAGSRLVTGHTDGRLRVWESRSLALLATLP
jgi:hypothetical protein